MASAPPPPPPQIPQPPPPPQIPSADVGSMPLSWEGDKMFNIYIYDYCHKRGFKKTAKELLAEADIAPESTPPINARQGLLFEWWSVFWVLFQAKLNPHGTAGDDALIYMQHQARQAASRMQGAPTATAGMNGPMPLGHQTGMPSRMTNGLGMRPTNGNQMLPNGTNIPNGIPVGTSGPFAPPNGATNPGNPPHGPGNAPSSGPGFMPGNVPRPPMNGPAPPPAQVQQVRGTASGPFHSPTMAHSPRNTGVPPPNQPQQNPNQFGGMVVGTSPLMANMHMGNRAIPPSPMNPAQHGGTPQPGQPGQMTQMQFGRPPSRTNTPAVLTQPSPSMSQRGIDNDMLNMDFLQIPAPLLESLKLEFGLAGKDMHTLSPNEKQRLIATWQARRSGQQRRVDPSTAGPMRANPPQLQQNMPNRTSNKRSSVSPGDEETLPRTDSSPPDRKRPRTSPMQTPSMAPMSYPGQQQPGGVTGMQPPGMQAGGGGMQGMPGPPGMAGHNPSMPGSMQGGAMQPGGHMGMPGGMQNHGHGSNMQTPSGGPGMISQGGIPQGGPAPGGMQQGAPGMQQGNPGAGMQPPMGNGPAGMMMMQPGPRMNSGMPSQMNMPPQMGMPQTNHPQMGPPSNPNPQNMMMYRQNMHNMHKNNMPLNAGSPSASDPSFNAVGPGPQFATNPSAGRLGANPSMSGQPQSRMPPPPSPAPGKDGSKDGKAPDGSPRNQQMPNPAPTTPAPNQQNSTSNHGTPVGGVRTAPSPVPNSVMGSLNQMNQNMGMNVGMMGMNPPTNLTQPPPTASLNNGGGMPNNNTSAGNAQNGGVTQGGGGSGMHFMAGMNPMVGMNPGTGLGMNMNLNMNPSGASMGNMGDISNNLFTHEFMQNVASALDDMDPNLFRPDGDLNFERDFGQWFNPDDHTLDLK